MLAAWPASMGGRHNYFGYPLDCRHSIWGHYYLATADAVMHKVNWVMFGAKCAHKTTHLNFYDYTLLYTLVYLLTIAR